MLPAEIEQRIDSRRDGYLENVLFHISEGDACLFEHCYDVLDNTHLDDAAAIGLSLHHQLTILEWHAEDYGMEICTSSFNDLRGHIEGAAAALICYLGESRAREALEAFEEQLEDDGHSFEQVTTKDNFSWFPPHRVRDEESATVYEYRNVEGSDVHVWYYQLTEDLTVYVEEYM